MLVAAVLLAGCSHAGSAARPSTSPSATPAERAPALPVLSEPFDLLPCDHNTTTGSEGCAESETLAADARVNDLIRKLWAANDDAGRRLIVAAQQAWVAYRSAACLSEADAFRDGSQRVVVYGECAASLTKQRATSLAEQLVLDLQGR
ncbi:MAG: lysozyme inhibitor LprI family protein [Mycobacteriales bacterium]